MTFTLPDKDPKATKTLISEGLKDNKALVKRVLESCKDVRIFAFYGELGAGKTTLIKEFCKLLGVDERVSSPTFGILHEYEGERGPVYHFDFYRLQHPDEAYGIGVDEYFTSGEYCFVEWPERVEDLLPESLATLHITVESPNRRTITLSCV